MSYDISIAADDTFTRSVPFVRLRDFISHLPNVRPNGERGLVLRADDRLWMEIDLEAVDEQGDVLDECVTSPIVNCVRLHIPYAFLGQPPHQEYFAAALAIAEYLGWPAIDEQTGEPVSIVAGENVRDKKPWWEFW